MSSGRRNSFSAKPVEQSTANLLEFGWAETLGNSLMIHLSLKYLLGVTTSLGRRPTPCRYLPPKPAGTGARTDARMSFAARADLDGGVKFNTRCLRATAQERRAAEKAASHGASPARPRGWDQSGWCGAALAKPRLCHGGRSTRDGVSTLRHRVLGS